MNGDCYLVDITNRNIIRISKKENVLVLLELLREYQVLLYEDTDEYYSSSKIKYAIKGVNFDEWNDSAILTANIMSNFNKHMPAKMRNNLSDIADAVIFGCHFIVSDVYSNLKTFTKLQYAEEHIEYICKSADTKRKVEFTHLCEDEWYEKDLVAYVIGDLPSFAEVLSRAMCSISYRTQKELEMLSILKKYKSTRKSLI